MQVRVPTSKIKLDILYSKFGIQAASEDAELLKTKGIMDLRKLGNIGKISNFGGDIPQCQVSLSEFKLWQ